MGRLPSLALTAIALVAPGVLHGTEAPDFQEVYDLVRSNLIGVSPAELNQAATDGLLQRLQPRVQLITNLATRSNSTIEPADTNPPPIISKSTLYAETYAYLHLDRIEPGAADAFAAALSSLSGSNNVNGLILDLRFTRGLDYAEAAKIADRFFNDERLLLQWGAESCRSTAKTNAITQPLAILVNHETTGAAEALAGVLRQADLGLVLGTNTAGQASLFREFNLRNGQQLRLAAAPVQLADGEPIPPSGISPDIRVQVDPADEKAYLADPYRALGRSGSGSRGPRASLAAASPTNRPTRLTEAELVRMRRDGLNLDDDTARPASRASSTDTPVINDPVLARAIDLLKGLILFRPKKTG